jgi:diacylglycerol kinase
MKHLLHSDIRETLAIDPAHHSLQVSRGRLSSLRYAIAGLLHMVIYAKNIRIACIATILVSIFGVWLAIPARDMAVIVLVGGMVWLAECINTAVEAAINIASPEYHPMARVGKDVAAGGVLLSVIVSVIVGLLILGPPLLTRLGWG